MDRARRNKTNVAVLFMDLDRFKQINDTLGHETGDRLLVEVSRRLQACVRSTDLVAERVLAALVPPIEIQGARLTATPSIGIALYPESGRSEEDLLSAADVAMYEAKRRGGGCYQMARATSTSP